MPAVSLEARTVPIKKSVEICWRRDWSGSVSNVSSSLANDLQPSYVPADPVFYQVLHHIEWYVSKWNVPHDQPSYPFPFSMNYRGVLVS